MTARLIDMLLRLSGRERMLLAIAALLLPLSLGVSLLLPLQEQHAAARTARSDAEALQAWILARIDEKQALKRDAAGHTRAPVGAPIGTSGIEQALIESRLRPALSALSAAASGDIDLRFDRVDFQALARWLTAMHPSWGYTLDSFRMEALEEDPGYIAAWISLSPAES